MKVLSLPDADRSTDIDIKLVSVRSSKYSVFGSSERIPVAELAVVDLRGVVEPEDFAERFEVLDRHPVSAVYLVRLLKQ